MESMSQTEQFKTANQEQCKTEETVDMIDGLIGLALSGQL